MPGRALPNQEPGQSPDYAPQTGCSIWSTKKKARERAEAREVAGLNRRPQLRKSGPINYPQGRITDHRIGLTLYNLDDIMKG